MNVSDQKITSRFPVGYYPFHRDIALNFQLNPFRNWAGPGLVRLGRYHPNAV